MDKEIHRNAQYFDELTEEGEVTIAQPRGVTLAALEDLKGNRANTNHSAQTST